MTEPFFLTLAEVIEIHKNQIELYGGNHGIRDLSLLQSAIAQPEASFGGEFLHKDIFEMAAAYAFHICQNHASLDGNKRAALASALVFLKFNNIFLDDPAQKLYNAMMALAKGQLEKKDLAGIFQRLEKKGS